MNRIDLTKAIADLEKMQDNLDKKKSIDYYIKINDRLENLKSELDGCNG